MSASFHEYSFIPLLSLIYMPGTKKTGFGVLKI